MGEGYYTAQICTQNGHEITSALELVPEANSKFCNECGSPTTSTCLSCHTPIRGSWRGGPSARDAVPNYCRGCGERYPWMAARLEAAEELVDLADQLTDAERMQLKKDLPSLVIEGPRTQVATVRVRQALGKIRNEAGPAMRTVLANIVTDAVRKGLSL